MRHHQLTLLACCLLLGSCHKDEADALPAATQMGQQTAGWLLQEKAQQPYCDNSGCFLSTFCRCYPLIINVKPATIPGAYAFSLALVHEAKAKGATVYLYVPTLTGPGAFQLNQATGRQEDLPNPDAAVAYGAVSYYAQASASYYITGPAATGQLSITRFDTNARIVAGTFEFTAREATGTASNLQVRKGRFDLRF